MSFINTKKKGIDVAGILVVVQFRINKIDFCTLSQRFGRAARDPKLHAIAVVLVEPTLWPSDSYGGVDGRPRKRRRRQQPTRGRPKRARLAQSCPDTQGPAMGSEVPPVETLAIGDDVEEDDEDEEDGEGSNSATVAMSHGLQVDDPASFGEQWTEYYEWSDQPRNSTRTRNSPGIEPAMRDLIRGGSCHRIPWKVYYSKSKALGKVTLCLW